MLFKLSVLAAIVAPLISAMTVSQPTEAVFNGGQMTFTWQASPGDPTAFSAFLVNPTFNSNFAIAGDVDASSGSGTLSITIPSVPPNQQYTIALTAINNINDVLATSPSFTIGADQSTAASTTAVSSPATTSGATTANTLTTTRASPTTSTTFGTIVSNTSPPTATRSGSLSSSSGSSAGSSSSAPSSSSSPNAALPVRFNMDMGVVASVVLSVFAGAAVVAL